MLPFSFREWSSVAWSAKLRLTAPDETALEEINEFNNAILAANKKLKAVGERLRQPDRSTTVVVEHLSKASNMIIFTITSLETRVEDFLFEGGFPEVWNLPTLLAKQEYLYQNQVERVIFEDLLVAAEFHPETETFGHPWTPLPR